MRLGVVLVAKDALVINEAVEALSQITFTMLNHRSKLTIQALQVIWAETMQEVWTRWREELSVMKKTKLCTMLAWIATCR